MSRQITGTLSDPSGTIYAYATIKFKAVLVAADELPRGAEETTQTDASGAYDITLNNGVYDCFIIYPAVDPLLGGQIITQGRLTVGTGAAITLPDIIALHDASQVSAADVATGDLVDTTSEQTLTNKTLTSDTNTISGGTF